MEEIVSGMLQSGELTLSVLVGIFLIWFIRSFWPGYVQRSHSKMNMERELREREMLMEERVRDKEIEAQQTSQELIVRELSHVNTSINSMHATFNDFLQNLLSQYMEERRELVDTGVFRGKDKSTMRNK